MMPTDIAMMIAFSIMLYSSSLWLIVYFRNRSGLRSNPKTLNQPSVTFLVPAYNEERNIAKCLRSLLRLDYPKRKVDIVVIDDGSKDRTAEIALRFIGSRVRLIGKRNEGSKAKALNFALRKVPIHTDLIAVMDADSWPERNYLHRIVGHFNDPDIAAVTPAMKVAEPKTLVQKLQWVEYLFSIFLRKLFALFDSQYVIPGPGGIYRTENLKKLKGWNEKNMTEDMEIAFRMHNRGWKLGNSASSYVFTSSPDTVGGLWKQRLRWYRGYLQNVRKYSHMIGNKKYGNLGFFLLPMNFIWIGVLAFLFFWPLWIWGQIAWNGMISWMAIDYNIMLPAFRTSVIFIDFYTFFWALFWILNIVTIVLSVKIAGEHLHLWKKKVHYVAFFFFYPILLSLFWFGAVAAELVRARSKW
jgi:cellulose synthase/poly-beta-1,6-N-acetylglucosamine synthase-like glycosyltransferase